MNNKYRLGAKYLGEKERIILPPPDITHTHKFHPSLFLPEMVWSARSALLSPYSTEYIV